MNTESSLWLGLTLVMVGGFVDGSVGLFLKYPKRMRWEHLWFIYNLLAFMVAPWVVGLLMVNDLISVLSSAELADVGKLFGFGLAWGIGAVFFGLSLKFAGMALSMAIVMGLTAAVGSLTPLVLLHSDAIRTPGGLAIIGAVLVIVVGVGLCSWAGHLKEASLPSSEDRDTSAIGQRPMLGVGLAILSGIFSPMINLGWNYGAPIEDLAEDMGTNKLWAPIAMAVIALNAGGAVNIAYCCRLISRSRTWNVMYRPSTDHFLGLAMGLLGPVGLLLFPMGTSQLGDLGRVIGWPIISSMGILSANFFGAVTGEWRGAGRKPVVIMSVAVSILVAAMFVLGRVQFD